MVARLGAGLQGNEQSCSFVFK